MTTICLSVSSRRRAVGLSACILAFTASLGTSLAQTVPYSLFQYATLTGSGETITATSVPVVTSAGILYKDITILFNVAANDNLTVASGYPQVVASMAPIVSAFRAGKYAGPPTVYRGDFVVTVSGPGIAPGGATEWALAAPSGGDPYTYPGTATWYVGPLATSPLAARLTKAGITSTAWSYGVSSSQYGLPWGVSTLIGVSQIGNALTFVSFTNTYGDQNEPVDQITYVLVP